MSESEVIQTHPAPGFIVIGEGKQHAELEQAFKQLAEMPEGAALLERVRARNEGKPVTLIAAELSASMPMLQTTVQEDHLDEESGIALKQGQRLVLVDLDKFPQYRFKDSHGQEFAPSLVAELAHELTHASQPAEQLSQGAEMLQLLYAYMNDEIGKLMDQAILDMKANPQTAYLMDSFGSEDAAAHQQAAKVLLEKIDILLDVDEIKQRGLAAMQTQHPEKMDFIRACEEEAITTANQIYERLGLPQRNSDYFDTACTPEILQAMREEIINNMMASIAEYAENIKTDPHRGLLIRTGGTIDAVTYDDPSQPPENVDTLKGQDSLVQRSLSTVAHLDVFDWLPAEEGRFVKDSKAFTQEDIETLAKMIKADSHGYYIITHGTDAMIKNAQALQEALGDTDKKVILVGSMVPLSMHKEHGGDARAMLQFAVENMMEAKAGVQVLARNAHTKRLGFHAPETVEKDRAESLEKLAFTVRGC